MRTRGAKDAAKGPVDNQLIDPMLRQRASLSLASLGSPRLLKYFATDLIKDDDGVVREQASRGVSNASRRGEEGYCSISWAIRS